MEIIHLDKIGNIDIPAVKIIPSSYKGIVLVIHGYGGCKEEMLGLSYRISESGYLTYTIDLRGHGDNKQMFDENIIEDVNQIEASIKENGKKVAIIGHSLGGRLALITKCDYSISISPAINKEFSEQTRTIINNLRSYHVKETSPDINFEILKNAPECTAKKENIKIIYGSRDIPEIITQCNAMKESGYDVGIIEQALHGDILFNNKTSEIIVEALQKNIG